WREVIAHHMTIGDLFSFTLYLGLVIAPVVQIVSIGTQLSEAFAGLERMREVLNEMREDAADPEKEPIAAIDGTVELRDVTFEYTPGVPVLRDIDLIAPAGKSIALVGPSGGGKSTLIGLVAAFQRPHAACGPRQSHRGPPAPTHPRRGHVVARQRERSADPGRPECADEGADDVRDRASALHDPQRRPDRGDRGRPRARARHARRADGAGRAVPGPVR